MGIEGLVGLDEGRASISGKIPALCQQFQIVVVLSNLCQARSARCIA